MATTKNGFAGSSILTTEPKPLHTERVRLRLPTLPSAEKADTPTSTPRTPLGSLRKGRTLDPLKVLEPFRKKLTIPESQKIIEVLDELILKCDVILLLPKILKDIQIYESVLGAELTSILISHRNLLDQLTSDEKNYQTIYERIHGPRTYQPRSFSRGSIPAVDSSVRYMEQKSSISRGTYGNSRPTSHQGMLSPDSESDQKTSSDSTNSSSLESQLEVAAIKFGKKRVDVEFSIKNVLRGFRSKENIIKRLIAEIGGTRAKENLFYLQCLNDLKEVILEKLLISPEEQQEKQQYMAQVAAQDEHNQSIIQNLEMELSTAVENRDYEIKLKNEQIKVLQHNLRNLESATEDDIRRAKTESEKQIQTDTRTSDSRKMKLDSELKQLKASLQNSTEENRREEQNMRKKKFKIESEIENWLQRYDTEMTEKQDEYEEIDALYTEEKRQLMELESRFKILEVEYKEIMEQRTAQKLQREAAVRLLEMQTRAAIIIQAIWRAFRVKKALRLKEKQKKKPKKGKKKK